jgi:hypothetical protein
MENLWRALDTAGGCLAYLRSGCVWLLLNLVWIVMLGAASYYGQTSWALSQSGVSVEGTVIALKESPATQDSGVTYYPVIKYDVGGQTYTFESSNSSDPPAYNVGERVWLRYDPADPHRARIDSWYELWLMPVMLGGAALVVAVVINVLAVMSIMRGFKPFES